MRINRFIALASGLSRRAADRAVQAGRVTVNGKPAALADDIGDIDKVALDGKPLAAPGRLRTVILNKPAGFVVSRDGQGSRTVYDLIPPGLRHLKPVGRLDKDSSGLLLLTDDGELAHRLTHPSFEKTKEYEVQLDKDLAPLHRQLISDIGLQLADGRSRLQLERMRDGSERDWRVTMHEGRNRQIRRTFAALGYDVLSLHRVRFGAYVLPPGLAAGSFAELRAR